jgi:ferredoxin-NADP reductase
MAKQYSATLLMSEFVTHNVKRFIISRPDGFYYEPGQGVELKINREAWFKEGRPFTPTSLRDDRVLEFTIKIYSDHNGVTHELSTLTPGAELLISEPFGTISYQGPGVFLAGGAGITPFMAILREQARRNNLDKHMLIFSNKTSEDIICEKELRHYLAERCIFITTAGQEPGLEHRHIDKDFLAATIDDFSQNFYVCGPPGFLKAVNGALQELGASPQNLVFEK